MGRGKKAAATGDVRGANANAGCTATGRDKVNKQCARRLAMRYCSQKPALV